MSGKITHEKSLFPNVNRVKQIKRKCSELGGGGLSSINKRLCKYSWWILMCLIVIYDLYLLNLINFVVF